VACGVWVVLCGGCVLCGWWLSGVRWWVSGVMWWVSGVWVVVGGVWVKPPLDGQIRASIILGPGCICLFCL
jgi:hypothetical protein